MRREINLFGVIAAAVTLFATGLSIGWMLADRGNAQIAQALGQQLRATLPIGTESRVVDSIESGRVADAVELLKEGAKLVDRAACVRAGTTVDLSPKGYVVLCENSKTVLYRLGRHDGVWWKALLEVDGDSAEVRLGKKADVGSDCTAHLLGLPENDADGYNAIIELACES